jgi:hypothetical protein
MVINIYNSFAKIRRISEPAKKLLQKYPPAKKKQKKLAILK